MRARIDASHAGNFVGDAYDAITEGIMVVPQVAANEPFPRGPWSISVDPGTWMQLHEEANGRPVATLIEEILARHLAYFSRFSGKL